MKKRIILFIKSIYVALVKPKLLTGRHIMDCDAMFDFMVNGGSIVRFGDGEFSIMKGIGSPDFQRYSDKLKTALDEAFDSREKKLLVCIPSSIVSLTSYNHLIPRAAFFWVRFLNKNYVWLNRRIDKENTYGDAQFSRPYMDTLDINSCALFFNKFKKTIKGKDVAIIEGTDTKFGVGNDLLDSCNSVVRIIGPSINAFETLDSLLPEVLKLPRKKLIIISLGPASKPLALTLHKEGFQTWDLGHLDIEYEWFLKNATEKILISGKYVNENPIHLNSELNSHALVKYNNEILFKLTQE